MTYLQRRRAFSNLYVNKNLSLNTDQTPHTSKEGSLDGDGLLETLDSVSFVTPGDEIQSTERKTIKVKVQNVGKKIKNLRKK